MSGIKQNPDTTGSTSGAGTAYPSGVHLSDFSGVRVTRSLVVCVCFVDSCLSFCTFLLTIVLSALLRFTDSDGPLGIFKLFLIVNSSDSLKDAFCIIHAKFSIRFLFQVNSVGKRRFKGTLFTFEHDETTLD